MLPAPTATVTASPTYTFTPSPPPPLAFTQADFTYDGDGARVKSVTTTTQGSSTTYFVNNYYEVTDGVATKYYYAGSQRLAMRKAGVLTYVLGDHLGSTSLVTDAAGNVISDTKYKAWGEERYTSGSKQTPYSFTGQYGHQAEFGLIHYGARMYDPSLSRFTSADIIVPAGVQGLDRYAYVNNSPLKYTDPSGHCAVNGDDWCFQETKNTFSNFITYTPKKDAPNSPSTADDYLWSILSPFKDEVCYHMLDTSCDALSELTWSPLSYNGKYYGKIDAIGVRFDVSYYYLSGGGGSVDFIFNFNSGELSMLPSLYAGGAGGGPDITVGAIWAYDAPSNDAFKGLSGGPFVTGAAGPIGFQLSHSQGYTSDTKLYSAGWSAGAEFAGGTVVGWTFTNLVILDFIGQQ